jgi:cbb3-type cytochrome oxidase subunit 3
MSEIMPIILWLQHHSVLFVFVVFVLLLATIYWPGRRGRFDRDARIPLEDDR